MVLETTSLNEPRTHMPFTTVGNSNGEAVVQYFSHQIDAMPDACGSFARLEGDNSNLAKECYRWGLMDAYEVGLWGHEGKRELYDFPAFVKLAYHWGTHNNRWECDEYAHSVSPGDFWKIYVR